ncbi:MAG: translation initiation factor IF-3 [Leptospirales bacterium]
MAIRRRRGYNPRRRQVRENRLNEEITEAKVRLVGEDGTNVVATSEALRQAKEAEVDLVEIAGGQEIPIVRIVDYGKFKFEKAKKDRESKRNQKTIQIKEVKMGPKIDVGDFDRKCSLAESFINDGDNVKVTMRFRGREMAHTELGLEKMRNFVKKLEGVVVLEKHPKLEGRLMTMVLRPKSKN